MRTYARKYPVATKRVVRAILKADRHLRLRARAGGTLLVDGGYTKQYDYALQALREIPYAKWRDYDPEDTIRFFCAAPA